jgi:hypothetical protein
MLTYPQLTHFPIVRRRRRRTVVNAAEDGRAIKLADPAGSFTEWQLEYSELNDAEAGALEDFFVAAEGSLHEFVFVDPTANLLAWNAKLDEAVWTRDPLLAVSAGDGYTRLTNVGAGPQSITQTIADGPAGFVYCFSAYARSENAASVHVLADGSEREQAIVPDWRRLRWSGAVEEARFGLRIGAGAVVDVRGLQVEAQAGASAARETTIGGIYKGARLRDDRFRLTTTGLNRHSCTVSIVHANHI